MGPVPGRVWGGLTNGFHKGRPLANGGALDSPLPILVRRDQGGGGPGQRRAAQPPDQGPSQAVAGAQRGGDLLSGVCPHPQTPCPGGMSCFRASRGREVAHSGPAAGGALPPARGARGAEAWIWNRPWRDPRARPMATSSQLT